MGSSGSRPRKRRRQPTLDDREQAAAAGDWRVADTPSEYTAMGPLAGIAFASSIADWLRRRRRRRSGQ